VWSKLKVIYHEYRGEVANKFNAKLQSLLERNAGYSTLCKDSDILCGNEAEFGGNEQNISANDLTLFKYSPVTSCDVERSFSRCKVLLSDNRSYFQFDNFKMHVIIHCNTTESEGWVKLWVFIIVKSKNISPFITKEVNSVYL
jgi:hypothetical protein